MGAFDRAAIRVDDDGVERLLGDGRVERVAWRDLEEVAIATTDRGPWTDDVFWVLRARDGSGCVVPSEAPGSAALLEWLQRLPGFENEKVVEAMGSTERAWFVCYRA